MYNKILVYDIFYICIDCIWYFDLVSNVVMFMIIDNKNINCVLIVNWFIKVIFFDSIKIVYICKLVFILVG